MTQVNAPNTYDVAVMAWDVPTAGSPSNASVYSSIWPGLGSGSHTDPLIQAGTEQDSTCAILCIYHNSAYYWWTEIYDNSLSNNQQTIIHGYGVYPGDEVSTFVQFAPATKTAYFYLTDVTRNYTIPLSLSLGTQVQTNYSTAGAQGEWILERTEIGNDFPLLTNVGLESIFDAEVAEGSTYGGAEAQPGVYALNMEDCAGQTLAANNGFSNSTSFGLQWKAYGAVDEANPACGPNP